MRQKRVVVAQYGGPEVIAVAEEEVPVPQAGEVRVKVLGAGVSLPDVTARGRPPRNAARTLHAGLGSRRGPSITSARESLASSCSGPWRQCRSSGATTRSMCACRATS